MNQGLEQAKSISLKGPLQIPSGPITRAGLKPKRIKEVLNALVQDIWAKQNSLHSEFELNYVLRLTVPKIELLKEIWARTTQIKEFGS